jgi:hypothetical protein
VDSDLRGDLLGAKAHLTPLALWTGVLAGPLAWATDLTVSYALVKWSCGHNAAGLLQVPSLAALAVTLCGAFIAWSVDPQSDRDRFLWTLALAMSALFVVVVIATAIPTWFLHVCR